MQVKELTKKYDGKAVVDSVSFRIPKGKVISLIGPNGAGKTTTIKMITGILIPDEGEIGINGHSLKSDPIAAKMSMGYVPDNHDIYEMLTGREYLSFMADMYDVPMLKRQVRIEQFLKQLELDKAVDRQISAYSHGMKQKLAVMSALLHEPALWILDEPLVGLDPRSAMLLKEQMRAHCAAGNTVFFSTHVLEVAERLCDRIGIVDKGKLIAVGTLDELRSSSGETLESIFLERTAKDA